MVIAVTERMCQYLCSARKSVEGPQTAANWSQVEIVEMKKTLNEFVEN